MATEFGKLLQVIRENSGDSARTMAKKLNMSPSYLSTIENGKRNIPEEMSDMLIKTYNLSDDDKVKLRNAMAESSGIVKIDITDLAEKKKQMIFDITNHNLDEDTIDLLCEIINKKKGEQK